jgi:ABC-type glycerol-3-phosphate transport system substrate-binding protein
VVTKDDGFKKLLNTYKQFAEIPGMSTLNILNGGVIRNAFYTTENLAIYVDWFSDILVRPHNVQWDMVTLPVFPESRNKHSMVDFHASYLGKNTKYPDIAYQVIASLLDRELQVELSSKAGKLTALKDNAEINSMFGSSNKDLRNKNLLVLTKTRMVPVTPKTKWELVFKYTWVPLNSLVPQYISGAKDMNTVLREASENAEKALVLDNIIK